MFSLFQSLIPRKTGILIGLQRKIQQRRITGTGSAIQPQEDAPDFRKSGKFKDFSS
jgi:hypothetical protein